MKRAKERGDEMVDECKQEAQATKGIGEKPVMKVTIAGHTAKDVKRLVDEISREYGRSHTLQFEVTF